MINYEYILENMEDFDYKNVTISAASEDGIVINMLIPASIDLLDFIEELGIYFYRIDDPKFGQKFINEETKLFIYDWLIQILNTGNYDEDENSGAYIADFELIIDFEILNTFKYALHKYKQKYFRDKKTLSQSRLFAEQTAIAILEIIEKIRLISLTYSHN